MKKTVVYESQIEEKYCDCVQVHSLFSLLSLHHTFVVSCGRLVGVVSMAEVQYTIRFMTIITIIIVSNVFNELFRKRHTLLFSIPNTRAHTHTVFISCYILLLHAFAA